MEKGFINFSITVFWMEDELTGKYLDRKGRRLRFMEGRKLDGLENDKGYRFRSMRDLVDQIKEDHKGLKRIWDRLVKGPTSLADEEDCLRLICWLREELNVYRELRGKGIEGVLWGEMEEIEKDIKDKDRRFGLMPNSIYEKTEYTHLR